MLKYNPEMLIVCMLNVIFRFYLVLKQFTRNRVHFSTYASPSASTLLFTVSFSTYNQTQLHNIWCIKVMFLRIWLISTHKSLVNSFRQYEAIIIVSSFKNVHPFQPYTFKCLITRNLIWNFLCHFLI